MLEGKKATLKMKKMLLAGKETDDTCFVCRILRYEESEECIYLVLEEGELASLSLEAVYTCVIFDEKDGRTCEGVIKERFDRDGKETAILKVKNGFYKINLNSVDKKVAE